MNDTNTGGIGKVIGSIVLFLILVILFFSSFGTIGAGERGVKTRFGGVIGELGTGLYLKIPIIEGVEVFDVQTQKEQVDAEAASSDLQDVKTTIAVNYNVDPTKVTALYTNIGTDYKTRVIDPAIQEAVKAATSKYTAEELITKRPEVQSDILASLTTRLSSQFINISQVSIINFSFSDTFNAAIEAKVTAEQNALAAKNKFQQTQYEASSTVASAEAQAESIKIQAQAINSQGGADYVQLRAIQQWDGHLPTQMVPGATVPFLNLSK